MPAAIVLAIVLLMGATAHAQPVSPTFTRDIAPILLSRCASCHRPGQGAPFSLVSFDDIRPRARAIVRAVVGRTMPPWKPEPNYGDFEGERRLTEEEIETVRAWAAGGFRQGEEADLPPTPPSAGDWHLGEPDLVVTMPETYELAPTGADEFRTFVIPVPDGGRRYVKAWEFKSASPAVVHHANIKIDRTRASRILDEQEPRPGYEGGASRKSEFPDGHYLGWTPGQSPRVLPDDMAWHLDPGTDLVVEAHLMPSTIATRVRLSIGLYFSDLPPARVPYTVRLSRQDIDIAAGERVVITDSLVLPVDVDVLSVQPHAHHLATEVHAFASLPDGTSRGLILIKNWDFHWQDNYRYKTPLHLPHGTTLTLRYTYDNSTANPRNPNRPPRRVTFGQTTASEMASLWVQVVPQTRRDHQILDAQVAAKLLRDDIEGYRKMIEIVPNDVRAHAALGHAYREAGRSAEAIVHFEHAAKIAPSPTSRYDLGSALLDVAKWEEAARQFNDALQLKPRFAEAAFGLGVARHQQQRLDDAIAAYRLALQFDLRYASANYNLGRALIDAGQPEAAMVEYRRAIDLDPGDVGALVDLAWMLATSERSASRDPHRAVNLAERAATITNRENAMVLDTLAIAYAAAGQLDRAIAAAETAERLAQRSGQNDLAARIRQRLDHFMRSR